MKSKASVPKLVQLAKAGFNKRQCLLITVMKLLQAGYSAKVINELKIFWTMNASEIFDS